MKTRTFRLWIVNVISFILFSLLGLTGLINCLILPTGDGPRRGFQRSLRHFLVEVHEWTALLFMIVIVVHIVLHWSYIKSNLEKHGIVR